MSRILVTGATGFVGKHLLDHLENSDWSYVATSRNPKGAATKRPEIEWEYLDFDERDSIGDVLNEGDRVIYLVHSMASGVGYAKREASAAESFAKNRRRKKRRSNRLLGGARSSWKRISSPFESGANGRNSSSRFGSHI